MPAAGKNLCQQFLKLAKMAKLKLVGLVPGVIGLERILEHMNEGEEKKDFAVLDLGTKGPAYAFLPQGNL